MIDKQIIFEIHRLKNMKLSIRQIAETLRLSRITVAKYIKHLEMTLHFKGEKDNGCCN